MEPLVIYGAGGFAREVLMLLKDLQRSTPSWEVLGFLDDDPAAAGRRIHGLPVLGGREWLEGRTPRCHVALGVGSPAVKRRLATALRGVAAGFPSLVHPTAVVGEGVTLEEGSIVTAGNILTADIRVRRFVTLNLACTVGHDGSIGDFANVAPGVNISGNVDIGEGCDLGTGGAVIQGVRVGAWSVVGAGAVVNREVPPNSTAVGVPAKVIKERPAGWHLDERSP